MKLIVETKGDIQVVGTGDELWARFNRPSVVRQVNFIQSHVSSGALNILAQVSDEASDAEFAEQYEALKDKSEEAVEALVAEYAARYATDKKDRKPQTPPPPPKKAGE